MSTVSTAAGETGATRKIISGSVQERQERPTDRFITARVVHDLNSTEFGLLLTLELANAPSSPAEQSAEQSKFTLVSPDQLAELLETSIEITLRLEEDEQILCFRFDEAKESTALG
ncbi:unnamed protein product [Durusdinium trenchii]|uniref:Uncharacterized protein n=1 Tax=Durusdinium trenchii TaxID=1381693 RepID=A0ABP0LFB1_9DINO